MKRKEKPTGRWYARNTHLRKQVVVSRVFKRIIPVDYSYQSKKKYQEPFSFTCPVTALPVSYRRRLTLCTALSLSTWPPRFTSHDLYLRCRSLASRAKRSFYFGPPKIIDDDVGLHVLGCRVNIFGTNCTKLLKVKMSGVGGGGVGGGR